MKVILFGSSIMSKWSNFTLKNDHENIVNKGDQCYFCMKKACKNYKFI